MQCRFYHSMQSQLFFFKFSASGASLQLRVKSSQCKGDYFGQTKKTVERATHEEIEWLIAHFEKVLIDVEFLNAQNPGRVMQRLRRLVAKTNLEKDELNILRGFLSAVEKKAL